MPLGKGDPHERGDERGAPFLKGIILLLLARLNIKMVADRHRHAACHNKHW